jgi:hypothetical protein
MAEEEEESSPEIVGDRYKSLPPINSLSPRLSPAKWSSRPTPVDVHSAHGSLNESKSQSTIF